MRRHANLAASRLIRTRVPVPGKRKRRPQSQPQRHPSDNSRNQPHPTRNYIESPHDAVHLSYVAATTPLE